MSTAAIVYSLIVFVGSPSGGVANQVIADYATIIQCEEAKESTLKQLAVGTFRATAACIAVPSFTQN